MTKFRSKHYVGPEKSLSPIHYDLLDPGSDTQGLVQRETLVRV